MRTLTFIAFMFTCGTNLLASERSWFTHFTNKVCEFTVTDVMVAGTPVWAEDAEYPPLSSRRALRAAKTALATVVSDTGEWKLEAVAMEPWDEHGHWIYVVTLRHLTASLPDGTMHAARLVRVGVKPSTVSIPVLLSGVAVEPKITPPKVP